MTTEVSPQSRIQVLDVPILAPGTCLLCGTSGVDDRKFVDFGKQVDWYGAVYLCSECIEEVARAIGFIPVAEFDNLRVAYKALENQKDLSDARYAGVVSALDTLFANYRSSGLSTDDILGPSLATENKSGGPIVTNEESIVREPETNESVDVEGSDDVFDDSDFE